jgi:hypothetical protein
MCLDQHDGPAKYLGNYQMISPTITPGTPCCTSTDKLKLETSPIFGDKPPQHHPGSRSMAATFTWAMRLNQKACKIYFID